MYELRYSACNCPPFFNLFTANRFCCSSSSDLTLFNLFVLALKRQMSLVGYFKKTLSRAKDFAVSATQFTPPFPRSKDLFKFDTPEACQNWIVGSDSEIGGQSEAYWGMNGKNAVFWGKISMEPPSNSNYDRSGYCAIRSKEGPSFLFKKERIDVSMFRYLELKVKGDDKHYMVNIATELYPNVIWQHRLHLFKHDEWKVVKIPFRDFVRTSSGFVQQEQIAMDRTAIKHIGISILEQGGEFCLELDYIRAVNTKNTLGDLDILADGEYVENGLIKRVKPGESIPREPLKWF